MGLSPIHPGNRRFGRHPGSQSRRFVPFKVGIVSAKQEALQTLRISENLAWNVLALHFEEID